MAEVGEESAARIVRALEGMIAEAEACLRFREPRKRALRERDGAER
jgi:hypothetical protein